MVISYLLTIPVIGDQVAKFAAEHLVEYLKNLQSYKEQNYKKSLEEVFLKVDEVMLQKVNVRGGSTRGQFDDFSTNPDDLSEAGCTSNVILITKDRIYCANAGDSRAVMSVGGVTVELSHDHKPDNHDEK